MAFTFDDLTQEHFAAGIKWLAEMSNPERWGLADGEAATLLGIDVNTYEDIRHAAANGELLTLNGNIVERLSLLLGIWKALQLIAPLNRQDLAFSWFGTANSSPLFGGKSIKQYLLEIKTVEALYAVKRHLDSASV